MTTLTMTASINWYGFLFLLTSLQLLLMHWRLSRRKLGGWSWKGSKPRRATRSSFMMLRNISRSQHLTLWPVNQQPACLGQIILAGKVRDEGCKGEGLQASPGCWIIFLNIMKPQKIFSSVRCFLIDVSLYDTRAGPKAAVCRGSL